MCRARDPGAARDGDLTQPRAHRGNAAFRRRARTPLGGRDRDRPDPGDVRRTLVAARPAQPERAETQGPAALPAANRGDVDAVPRRQLTSRRPGNAGRKTSPGGASGARDCGATGAATSNATWRGALPASTRPN